MTLREDGTKDDDFCHTRLGFSQDPRKDCKFRSKEEALTDSPLLPAQDRKPLSFEEATSTG
jgi:hypothetical protein